MTTTINKTDGSVLTIIADGTVDNTSSLVLIGKNYANYGEFVGENFVHLLENGSNSTPPSAPLSGQLWWDTTSRTLKVWTGVQFKVISSSTSQDTPPENPIVGDLWWDTFNGQLNVYNGTQFTLIGPAFTTAIGTSGTIVDSIVDENGDSHIAIKVFIEETLVAVISKDSAYVVSNDDAVKLSLVSVDSGINLVTDLTTRFVGTATSAENLMVGTDEIPPSSFARTDISSETFAGSLTITNNGGITIGASEIYSQSIAGNTVVLQNSLSDINSNSFEIKANVDGTMTEVIVVSSNAEVTLSTTPNITTASNLSVATMQNIREVGGTEVLLRDGSRTVTGTLMPSVSTTWNLGNSAVRFGTFYGSGVVASTVQAATIGNTGAAITGASVSAATIGNAGAAISGNVVSANTITTTGNITSAVGLNASYATIGTAIYAANYYFANGTPFIPGVASLNSQLGTVSISGSSGISVGTSTGIITVSPTSGYNGYGVRTVSSSAPSGGSNGDVWYQI